MLNTKRLQSWGLLNGTGRRDITALSPSCCTSTVNMLLTLSVLLVHEKNLITERGPSAAAFLDPMTSPPGPFKKNRVGRSGGGSVAYE